MTFDARGRFYQHTQGPVERTAGYDGKTPWWVFWGVGAELALAERETTLVGAWLRSNYWLAPRAPLAFALLPSDAVDGATRVKMILDGGLLPWVVAIDPDTWLPRTVTLERAGRKTLIRLDEYEDHAGWQVPRRLTVHAYGRLIRESVTESLTRLRTVSANRYTPRLGPPADTRFDPEAPSRLEVRREPGSNRLLVHPLVQGRDVGWFLLDTGAAGWTITREAAERAGLETISSSPTTGAAGRAIVMDVCRSRTLQLGPATFSDQIMRAVDSAGVAQDSSGLISYGLFARCVVEYDASAGIISIHDPQSYERKAAIWLDLVPGQVVPTIEAAFEGHTELFRIDTGSTSAVVFNSPCVERLALLENRQTRSIEARGGDASFTIQRGSIDWIELAGRRFESVLAEFSTMRTGVLADAHTAGIIGSRLLEPFTVILDHPHGRIAFVERS